MLRQFVTLSICLFLVLLIPREAQAQTRPGFIATFPSSVLANAQAKFCIRFENLNTPVSFFVEDDEPHIFDRLQETASPSDPQKCVDINIYDETVVADESSLKNVKQIKVSGKSNDGSYEFNETRRFTYKTKNRLTLIETDKPVYKPGDKVRIRLLTLDHKLRPQRVVYKQVYVYDPSGSRVNQWLDVENTRGLVDLELPMSREPNLGKWIIEVREGSGGSSVRKAVFEVKKYVLPKFEVVLNHKNKVSSSDEAILVSVCAKYSHGGNVRGSFSLHAYTKRFYNDEKIRTFNNTQEGKGCVDFKVVLKEIGVEPRNYVSEIYLEAGVTEAFTEISTNANSKASISFYNFEADFIEPSYYKPGLPINFKIFVKSGDNQGLKNKNIDIELRDGSTSFHKRSVQTDQDGYVEFTFQPTACSSDCKASSLTESPGTISIKIVEQKNGSTTAASKYHYVRPWSSATNSYIQVVRGGTTRGTLRACNDTLKTHVIIRSPYELNKQRLYFQIQSGVGVLSSGHFDIERDRIEMDSTASSVDLLIRTIKTNKIELASTAKYNYAESSTDKNNAACKVKVENGRGKLTSQWFYDVDKNRCRQRTSDATSPANSFDSKKKCDDECKIKEFYYDLSGAPVASIKSKKTTFNEKQFELTLKLDERMSPETKILLYSIVDGEIVADSFSLDLEKCLKHQVNLSLHESNLRVGKRASIEIKSEPNSICALSAIDKSVTFMGTRNTVDLAKIFDGLADMALIIDSENNYNDDFEDENCNDRYPRPPIAMPMPMPRPNRPVRSIAYRPFYSHPTIFDSTKAFKDGRVIYLSDFHVSKECIKNTPIYYAFNHSKPPQYPLFWVIKESVIMMKAAMPRSGILARTGNAESQANGPVFMMANNHETGDLGTVVTRVESATMRQYFPETWLWKIDVSDDDGLIQRREKAPDTITDWILDAYCVSDQSGLGIAPTQVLKVFQPLFVSVNLPYSVVRGETFPVKTVIFNYETSCLPIKIEIITDRGLMIDNSNNRATKVCLCPEEETIHQFNLKAAMFENENGIRLTVKVTSLDETDVCVKSGKKISKYLWFQDSESRNILVEPEGIAKEQVESSLIILNANESSGNQSFDLTLPKDVVPRSSRLFFSVIGDSMGSVLSNLDNLVQQPTGCGEQNMVKFAPIISVARYLLQTFQMTSKMRDLTQNYLIIGYQRQLTYRHEDGSFSAFGPSSSKTTGGTWLTAFVLRSFADALKLNHVKFDEKDLRSSATMLLGTQDESDGSFTQVGVPLMSKAMSGGLKSDQKVGLTAYVLISLLKTFDALKKDDELASRENLAKIEKAYLFLKNAVKNLPETDTYTLALILYAFKIGRYERVLAQSIDAELNKRGVKENDMMYWKESKQNKPEQKSWYEDNRSADLEITAYILLAKLVEMDKRDLTSIVPISRWINSQRNSLGGFYSTQDTVVALDALAEFARLAYAKNTNLRLTYYLNGAKNVLLVNDLNRLLLRKVRLDRFIESDSNKLSFEVEGTGTVLVQAILKYNIANENKIASNSDFEFSAFSSSSGLSDCSKSKLNIKAKYTGAKESSSMAIVAIRLPSGWEADQDSIQKLTQTVDLKRFEVVENKISLYFDQLTKAEIEFDIDLKKRFEIKDTKPGLLSVYDYYEPMDEAFVQQFEISNDCN